MVTITATTPYGEPLTLTWKDRKVKAKGSRRVVAYWEFLQDKGMYGMYGHILDLDSCSIRDLAVAVASAFGPDNYILSQEAKEQVDREIEYDKKNPIPKGATT